MLSNPGLQALFEHASIGIIVINASGEIVLANRFLLKQFGYSLEELIGKDLELLIPARFQKSHMQHRSSFFDHPQSRPMGIGLDLYAVNKEGKEFPVEVSLTYFSSEGNHFAAAYISDITVRKTAENALSELNAELEKKVSERTLQLSELVKQLGVRITEAEEKDHALQRANAYLNNILDHAGAIIMATNRDGNIELFNPAAEMSLGYTAKEVVGRHNLTLFLDVDETEMRARELSREFKQRIKPGLDTLLSSARLGMDQKQEWTYVAKDGHRIPVMLTVTSLGDAFQNTIGFLTIAIDISDRKKAEAELLSALKKEKELNELKSKFVSIASHEFRTPLSTILSSVQLIGQYRETDEQDKREKHIQRIVSSINMLTDILNDFLSVGKIEEGKIQVHPKEFNIKVHVQQTVKELNSLCKKGQHILYTHKGEDMVQTDPALLKHILINLVSNAIKFSPENAQIAIRTQNESGMLSLSVKDHGIGIPKADQQHLFGLFYRASNADHFQGTGLGLHIIKRYTDLLHGEIKCKSEVGKGTEFQISLTQ